MPAPAPNETMGPAVSRRFLLKAGSLIGGGCLLGFQVRAAGAAPSDDTGQGSTFAPNAFIRIASDGQVTLIMPQAEMGQGIYTAHAMMLAEELDADFGRVAVEASPPSDALYGNPVFGLQATGNSNSVRAFWIPLRTAGAAARAMLISAAAATWSVEPSECRTEIHQVIHDGTGRKLDYGALAAGAALVTPPTNPPLKSIKDFRLIGKPLKRLDTPGKVNGKVVYGIDTLPEGVKFATLAACPVFGGKVRSVDDSKTKSIPGFRQVLVFDDFVATVGDHTWAALQALAALEIVWDKGPSAHVDSEELWDRLRTASEQPGAVAKSVGDVDAALREGETVQASYQLPFLAHADMEPMNCTVHVRPDGCDVWAGSQVQARAQAIAAEITGLPLDRVKFQNSLLGGGFGRRLEVDYVARAVRVGQRVDGPVKVIWSREEDIQHDVYRPLYYDRITASLRDGKVIGWNHRIAGSSIVARWLPAAYTKDVDFDAVDSAVDMPYDIPNRRVQYVRHEPLSIPTGFWRGVGPNNNVFAIESFVDELAAKLHKDPVAFRRELLAQNPRLRAALDLAASKAGWGEALPPRVGRGVSAQISFASFIVSVAEAEVDTNGEVRLRRVVCAVDTGIAVNPDTIVAQLQGGLIFGLTAALFGEITIAGGRVQQNNFNDYRMLRINEVPPIEVHVIDSDQPPGGIGETGCTAAPAALTNAIFAATGIRLRKLPIDRDVLAGRKPA